LDEGQWLASGSEPFTIDTSA